jgi:hypothetical protein
MFAVATDTTFSRGLGRQYRPDYICLIRCLWLDNIHTTLMAEESPKEAKASSANVAEIAVSKK